MDKDGVVSSFQEYRKRELTGDYPDETSNLSVTDYPFVTKTVPVVQNGYEEA